MQLDVDKANLRQPSLQIRVRIDSQFQGRPIPAVKAEIGKPLFHTRLSDVHKNPIRPLPFYPVLVELGKMLDRGVMKSIRNGKRLAIRSSIRILPEPSSSV